MKQLYRFTMEKTLPVGSLVDTVEIRTSHPDFSSALIISFTFGFGRIIQWPVKALNSSGTPSIQVHNIPIYLLYLCKKKFNYFLFFQFAAK